MPSESSADSVSPNSTSAAKPVNSPSLPVAAPSTSGALEVTFKGKGEDAWVEVKDVGGAVIFSKLVHFGDTYVVKGVPVLTVVVGLADSVDVLVRGQALDLSPFSRGAVARFEVK